MSCSEIKLHHTTYYSPTTMGWRAVKQTIFVGSDFNKCRYLWWISNRNNRLQNVVQPTQINHNTMVWNSHNVSCVWSECLDYKVYKSCNNKFKIVGQVCVGGGEPVSAFCPHDKDKLKFIYIWAQSFTCGHLTTATSYICMKWPWILIVRAIMLRVRIQSMTWGARLFLFLFDQPTSESCNGTLIIKNDTVDTNIFPCINCLFASFIRLLVSNPIILHQYIRPAYTCSLTART